jgi:hypothetical protein
MSERRLGFWARLGMFFWLPWKVLFDGAAAYRIRLALRGESAAAQPQMAEPPVAAEPVVETPPVAEAPRPAPSHPLHLLAILQRDGRLVDFLQEDIAAAADDQVGAAARIVHEGCRKALAQYVTLVPLRDEEEGASITVPAGYDATQLRLSGNVVGSPPFRGTLAHPGWRAAEVRLPELTVEVDPTVIAPAEVEI